MADRTSNDYRPPWACRQWGQYEHDWLDCPGCIDAYERYLEQEHEDEHDSADRHRTAQ